MTNVTIQMLVTIEYDPADQTAESLGSDMLRVIEYGMGAGFFTQLSDATVESWDAKIVEVPA